MAGEHPIQGLMMTAMENLKEMIDVNTIIGEPVETVDGQIIIPVSKVGFGFAAGGSEFVGLGKIQTQETRSSRSETSTDRRSERRDESNSGSNKQHYPFGGGSGGGVSITPVAFIVVGPHGIRLLNLEGANHLYDRLIDSVPQLFERFSRKKHHHSHDGGCHPECE
ncbi:GerW family sporulation protein [Thermoactinomyces sp. DSM 45892]|uniref:GerW family sporulation protein n=1 Tax=Thermoactinomyces sp. DSM 45892 TaxID=1882753 RepID=UPI000896E46B|nr:GerW family sporulation protein [Thermoactinomyces sp. DSM 45892]SDZ09159.1 sporulation protein YtfJ [Thermoactinomyces sp. DSM 45892]